jgi:hypothetical protein
MLNNDRGNEKDGEARKAYPQGGRRIEKTGHKCNKDIKDEMGLTVKLR